MINFIKNNSPFFIILWLILIGATLYNQSVQNKQIIDLQFDNRMLRAELKGIEQYVSEN